jgi:hypothetical protein
MTPRAKVVVIVCIAILAFTAITPAPMFALIDAQTPIDALFWSPAASPAPAIEDVALPAAPAVVHRSPRAPPVA